MSNPKFLEEFPPVPTGAWDEAIRKDLKGADYDKKLIWQTDEQIGIKPYYRREDLETIQHLDARPGEFPYTRGTTDTNAWRIRERVEVSDVAAAKQRAASALASGAEEIQFAISAVLKAADIADLTDGLKCPVHFEAGERAQALLPALVEALARRADLEGSLDYDPLAGAGDLDAVRTAKAALARFRPLMVRAHRFHDSGATATQELGYALAEGVEYLSELSSRGMSVDEAASCLTFSFAAGPIFFFEIAKLRAARMLWAQAVEAFRPASPDAAKAHIQVRTSRWTKTIYDPYVNALRATTEAMSAAMGGCDSLAVAPFDETYRYGDDASRRLARNTQLILKNEALLDRSVDPAGGSYFVEVLTDSLARESWKIMQEIEAAGGFRKAWTSGAIPAAVEKSRAAKMAAVSSRRRTILGTNQYPNRKERMLDKIERRPEDRITPRASEQFEAIRLRTEASARKTGRTPVFLLVETGDLKMRKARSGFAANFFGCAGFDIQTVQAGDAAAAAKLTAERKPDAVVLCSSDEEYPALAPAFCAKLREAGGKAPVIVAGYPQDSIAALKEAGVADFVHIRSNVAEVLSAWQAKLGVEQ